MPFRPAPRRRGARPRGPRTRALIPLAAVGLGLGGCLVQPVRLVPSDADRVLATRTLDAPDPAAPGPYTVASLAYGSGNDRQRAIFRDSVTYTTAAVDGRALVSFGDATRSRRKYWGFGADSLPVNGRVWYPTGSGPRGDGPFPLVLVVHGNHDMKDFSDPGYAWLGELFASRGFVVVSVDENFLNGATRGENDARGWMLLEHLTALRAIADTTGKPLHDRLDLSRIVLMGHSRGGEAVAIAGAFNRLSHYPDDATKTFDFGFDIRGLVAIAPVDGQYTPSDKGTPLRDVSYLVMHGSHDGDVSAFSGLAQYERLAYTAPSDHFKSALWVYRANHGQWNTVWGNRDNGRWSPRQLALDALLDADAQRRVGAVAIGAFLEAVLHDDDRYRAFFRDHRVVGDWLPPTMYVTRYWDARTRAIATYDDDIDVTTGSAPGVTIAADSLTTWREADVPLRWRGSTVKSTAARYGWNNRPAPGAKDTTPRWPARVAFTLDDSLRRAWQVGERDAVLLALRVTDARPGPRKVAKDSAARDSSRRDSTRDGSRERASAKRESGSSARADARADARDSSPPRLSVELEDAAGHRVRLPLDSFGPLRRPIESYVYRRRGADKSRFTSLSEQVLQTYVLPLARFRAADAAFDPAMLRTVRLVFDGTAVGEVLVDDVGLTRLAP